MAYERVILPSFCVIGIEGTTDDGPGFIQALWDKANSRFGEVAHLAAYGEGGGIRVWGLMSDMSMSFKPWEDNFTKGRYLAGVEALPDAEPPAGWTKWVSPAYEYVAASQNGPDAFPRALNYLAENGFSLAGAAYDLTIPGSGSFIYLPIRKT